MAKKSPFVPSCLGGKTPSPISPLAFFCHPAYIANALQYRPRHLKAVVAPLTASVLVALVLVLNALAVCPALHERLHPDAHEHGHECAVTLFAHGLLDQVSVAVAPVRPVPGLELRQPVFLSAFVPASVIVSSARGPPVFAVS